MSAVRNGETIGLLTCITCRVGFRDGDLQRDHYKSDWHRYNLKRKIVQLAPVTAENFQERVSAQQELEAGLEKDTSQYCTICKKAFGNDKAFRSHLVSKKHLQAVKETSSNLGAIQGNIKDEVVLADDLSSKCVVDDINKPVKTPGKKFPTPQPIVEITKGNKLGKGNQATETMDVDSDEAWEEIEGEPIPVTDCLFCEENSEDVEANLEHMSVAHSFFIPDVEYCVDVEGLLEYLGGKVGEGMMCLWCNEKGRSFYTVKAVQQHMQDKGHCKILHEDDAEYEYTDFYDYSSSYPDGCQDVNPDEAYQPEVLQFNENMQLVLPSGVTLGHRALKIYYKQYIRPTTQLVLRKAAKRNKILSQYRSIGYGPTDLTLAQQKHRDQKIFKHVRDKYHMKLGVKGNKTLQHHFRQQVQF